VVTPREAATVMLVRDDPDLEVFMLRRSLNADWVGGAYVFPGGAVDEGDRAPAVLARCRDRSDADASARLGVATGGLGYWVAGVRETFEEAGVLLARSVATGAPVGPSSAVIETRRNELNQARLTFEAFLEAEDLVVDVEALHYFSHWITPEGNHRRYDTRFFVAAAPDGHAYLHDDAETVASIWIRPADALAAGDRGELDLIFPTRKSLESLSRFAHADELLDAVRSSDPPQLVREFGGTRVALPGDPDDTVGVA
jgi:8-oxo-dGTP pyrophosphatase MutT (NUDIX family)